MRDLNLFDTNIECIGVYRNSHVKSSMERKAENQQRLLDANQTLEARSDFGFLLNQSNLDLNAQERRWVDVSNGVEIAVIGNPQEAEKVSEILDDLIHWFEKEGTERDSLSVALLTPYVNQSRTIRMEANAVLQKRKTSMKGTRCNIRLKDNRIVTIFARLLISFRAKKPMLLF